MKSFILQVKLKFHINSSWLYRAVIVAFLDILIVLMSYFIALVLRFDFSLSAIPAEYMLGYARIMPVFCITTIIVFYICRLYHVIWRYAGAVELGHIVKAYIILLVVFAVCVHVLQFHMPRSCYLIGYVFSFLLHTALRFSYRYYYYFVNYMHQRSEACFADRIMIIGAGAAGRMIVRELISSEHLKAKVCCIIDDNREKIKRNLEGIPIVGHRYDIPDCVKKYHINHIIFAIPTASAEDKHEILNICKECECKLQTLPGIYQLVNDEVSVSKLKDVDIQDLLGRDQINVNNDEVFRMIRGLTVLITGGGGSIGSELCRQIASHRPKRLIIFDVYENNAYDIQQELKRRFPELTFDTLIGSVRNTSRINYVMEKYRPDIVFHAAAHKHVPLMEDSPNEAIKNNVMGTYKTACASARFGTKKFVLISTDKAVNPTNIMGASKRICEMIVQMMDRRCQGTDFVAVRFGNVLGSNGSVIPLFKKQIAEGGPVTVTDKNVIRYFMTIPEAVSLVLQASHYAKGGEIFVLDMGEPVRIDDMARNLIRLSGYKPDEDIKIVYTGLRPGEKLYEEILMDEEGLTDTENELIHIGHPIEMDDEWFLQKILEIDELSCSENDRIRSLVAEIVPTYQYKRQEKQPDTLAEERIKWGKEKNETQKYSIQSAGY